MDERQRDRERRMDSPWLVLVQSRSFGPVRRAVNLIGAIFFGVLLVVFVAVRGCSLPLNVESTRKDGAWIIEKIDGWVRSHGHPPTEFSETGEKLPNTQGGPWKCEADESGYGIEIGAYDRNGVVLSWSSDVRAWHEDR